MLLILEIATAELDYLKIPLIVVSLTPQLQDRCNASFVSVGGVNNLPLVCNGSNVAYMLHLDT